MAALLAPLLLCAPRPAPDVGAVRVGIVQADPLIGRLLRASPDLRDAPLTELGEAAAGLSLWRRTLAAGRTPDFGQIDAHEAMWPAEPLLSALTATMASLHMPRTTARHPSLIPAALEAVLAAALRFRQRSVALADDAAAAAGDASEEFESETDGGWDSYSDWDEESERPSGVYEGGDQEDGGPSSHEETKAELARELAEALAREWRAPLRGVRAIESLGVGAMDAGAATASPGAAFSPHDGLWSHDGWVAMEAVQTKLRELDELNALFDRLGERAGTDGVPRGGPSALADARAAPSAALSELAPREIAGLCRTGNLARVAPAELILLARGSVSSAPEIESDIWGLRLQGRSDLQALSSESAASTSASDPNVSNAFVCGRSVAPDIDARSCGRQEQDANMGVSLDATPASAMARARRRLFLSRLVEQRLLGYSLEGWAEASASPLPRRRSRLPRERGGPLVVCLDTSHSMAGGRERLAKVCAGLA